MHYILFSIVIHCIISTVAYLKINLDCYGLLNLKQVAVDVQCNSITNKLMVRLLHCEEQTLQAQLIHQNSFHSLNCKETDCLVICC